MTRSGAEGIKVVANTILLRTPKTRAVNDNPENCIFTAIIA